MESRTCSRRPRHLTGGGLDIGAYSITGHFFTRSSLIFGLYTCPMIVLDGPAQREPTERPFKGPFGHRFATQKSIKDRRVQAPTPTPPRRLAPPRIPAVCGDHSSTPVSGCLSSGYITFVIRLYTPHELVHTCIHTFVHACTHYTLVYEHFLHTCTRLYTLSCIHLSCTHL